VIIGRWLIERQASALAQADAGGAVAAQFGATQVFAETSAQKATTSCSGGSSGITLPNGFCATIFADKIGHARQLVVAPDGTVFVNTWSGVYYGNDGVAE
jgi:hypothetical protein